VSVEEQFLADLARAITRAGGPRDFPPAAAHALAKRVLQRMREIGPYAYPSLVDAGGLRFVYQWDEVPPVVVVMYWNDEFWQDMERVVVPPEIDREINH